MPEDCRNTSRRIGVGDIMKVLDVDHLQDGLTHNINRMNRLEKEITAIQKAVEELTAMEDALKGQGGQAIRDFYTSCHLPFLQYFLTFKEEFNTVLQQTQQALSSLEPVDDGHIVEEFLETKVEEGLTASADITTALTDEANAIMDEVADIVGLPKLDDTLVHESIANAKTKRDDTVEALHTFDSTQTAQLLPIETSIQSMKEWVKNIEGLFQAGLTDVDFPADTWSAMASRSSLGMAIAAQQAPVGSVAHTLHEQNQLTLMLQASLSNMAPIRFGFGGFAQKSYPTYGPVMLGLGNLSRGNQTSETVQQVSKSSDPDLEEIYAALAKQAEGIDVSSPSSPGTYSAKEEITYEGMRKVLGGNGSGTPDGLAPYAVATYDFFAEDMKTILDPNASNSEYFQALSSFLFKPVKLLDKAGDVAGAAKNAGKAVDDVKSTGKTVDKGTGKSTKNTTTLWDIKTTADKTLKCKFNGGIVTAYRDPKTGLWWAKDTTGHANSTFKVFKEAKGGKELHWVADSDKYGNYILDKHKSSTGTVIKIK